MFAGLADNPNLNLAHMKRQLNNLQVILFPCLTLNPMHKSETDDVEWIDGSRVQYFSHHPSEFIERERNMQFPLAYKQLPQSMCICENVGENFSTTKEWGKEKSNYSRTKKKKRRVVVAGTSIQSI